MMSITLLAPCYNEIEVIEQFVAAVDAVRAPDWELLLVDDGSRDGTTGLIQTLARRHPWLRCVGHSTNRGLGAALRTGFAAATGSIIVTIDADLSHPVTLIGELAGRCDEADAAFASRFVPGGSMRGVPLHRRLISTVGNRALRWVFRIPVRDTTTGFRAYRAEIIRAIEFESDGFEAQFEIAARLARAGARVVEVPLPLANRQAGSSKMHYLRLIRSYARLLRTLSRRRSRAG